jgi:hypothetical protein
LRGGTPSPGWRVWLKVKHRSRWRIEREYGEASSSPHADALAEQSPFDRLEA